MQKLSASVADKRFRRELSQILGVKLSLWAQTFVPVMWSGYLFLISHEAHVACQRGCLLILVFPINCFIPCNSICVISVTRSQCPVTPVCLFVPFSHQSVYLAFINCWVAVACRVSDEGDSEA